MSDSNVDHNDNYGIKKKKTPNNNPSYFSLSNSSKLNYKKKNSFNNTISISLKMYCIK